MYSARSFLPPKREGFSLVEMLVVISIVTVMAVLVQPAIGSLFQAQGFSSNVTALDDVIQKAKAAASAQNTFVWLGFATTNTNGNPSVVVGAVGGSTGVSSDYQNGNTYPIMKPVILRNMQIVPSGNYSSTPNLAGFYSLSSTDCSQSAYPSFSQNVGGVSTTFQSVIAFNPDGEVCLSPNLIARVGIGLKAGPVNSAIAQIALIQISGASGRPSLFRQ